MTEPLELLQDLDIALKPMCQVNAVMDMVFTMCWDTARWKISMRCDNGHSVSLLVCNDHCKWFDLEPGEYIQCVEHEARMYVSRRERL